MSELHASHFWANPVFLRAVIFSIKTALLVVLGVSAAWFLFVVTGLPMTTVDDLYFVGIADSWQSTGVLTSRFMTPEYLEGFPSRTFYFHPPVYPAILATWLTMWPKSELSLQTFAFTSILVGVTGILLIGRHFSVSLISRSVVCLAFVIGFSRLGLRPEVLAVSSLLLGTGLLLRSQPAFTFLAFLAYGLSIFCYPFTAPLAVAFTLYAFWLWPERNRNKSAIMVSLGLVAVLLWALFTLILIDWQVQDFWASYRLSVEVVNPGALFTLDRYMEYFDKLSSDSKFLPKWPFVLVGPLLLVWTSVFQKSSSQLRMFCWAFTFGVLGAAGMAHLRAVDLSVFYSLAVSAMLLDTFLQKALPHILGQAAVIVLALIANVAVVVSITLQSSIDTQQVQKVRKLAADVPSGHHILVDSPAARHVFNWQLGNNAFDFRTSRQLLAPFGTNFYPRNLNDIRDDEVWIVGRDFSYSTETPGIAPKPVTVMGKALGSVGMLNCDPLFITRKNGLVVVE